jgi:hypothetical protein
MNRADSAGGGCRFGKERCGGVDLRLPRCNRIGSGPGCRGMKLSCCGICGCCWRMVRASVGRTSIGTPCGVSGGLGRGICFPSLRDCGKCLIGVIERSPRIGIEFRPRVAGVRNVERFAFGGEKENAQVRHIGGQTWALENANYFNAANYFFALGAFGAFGGLGAGLPQSERAAAEIIAPASCLVMYPALRQALTALVMAETY